MSNIVTLGMTGFLGSYLMDCFNTQGWPGRFEHSSAWWAINQDESIDFVFYCARACRKKHPRRDKETVMLDTEGLIKAIKTFPNAHFLYCSTKVVDGWVEEWQRPISRITIGNYFQRVIDGEFHNSTIHLPEISTNQLTKFPPQIKLSQEHALYADTKLIGETLVKSCVKDYTIFRIWDITQ